MTKAKGERPMLVLSEFMRNADRPMGNLSGENDYRSGWYAGDQVDALRFYLAESVEVLCDHRQEDYQGSCYALLRVTADPGPVYVLWRDSFGSCSGCDGLSGEDGYAYIKATLAEGNTRQFWTLEGAVGYLAEKLADAGVDYEWQAARPLLDAAKGVAK